MWYKMTLNSLGDMTGEYGKVVNFMNYLGGCDILNI